ncbi:MAG: alkaline phosphatase [Gemmatimonadetes bacterium]|nr:alkaline phosphatase [Gemmatimonadota bacterium]
MPRSVVTAAGVLALIALGFTLSLGMSRGQATAEPAPGSVIFFHPDGMGVNTWGAVRMMTVGPDGRLNWDRIPHMAVYTGHMKDRLTSTSHGGATTHAYGVKVLADSYGMDGNEPLTAASGFTGSILQEAHAAGLAVGIVNSGTITEPGSGAFAASHPERYAHEPIALQIFESGAEVILGGGEQYFLPEGADGLYGPGARRDGRDLIAEAAKRGYTVVRTRAELLALPDTSTKVLGLFARYHTFNDQPEERLLANGLVAWPEAAPTIAEMTRAALDVLSRGDRRFFLASEEEGTDNMANANNAMGEIMAGQRADEAIGVIQAFIADHPNTLLLMTSDSDAGGMQVFGQPFPADTAPATASNGAPMDGVEGTNGQLFLAEPDANGVRHPFAIAWAQYHDVSGGILMKAQGLGAERVRGTMDNTEAYRVMYSVLFGPLPRR